MVSLPVTAGDRLAVSGVRATETANDRRRGPPGPAFRQHGMSYLVVTVPAPWSTEPDRNTIRTTRPTMQVPSPEKLDPCAAFAVRARGAGARLVRGAAMAS